MADVRRYRTSFLTDTTSSATAYLPSSTETNPGTITGIVDTILYYKDGTSPPTTTAAFSITVENTSQPVLTLAQGTAQEASWVKRPVYDAHLVAGTTAAAANALAAGVLVSNSRLVIAVSTAGDAKRGIFEVLVR